MPTSTTRLGLSKAAGNEPRSVTPINSNFDIIDGKIGTILVNDGVTPPDANLFDGAIVKEKTSGKVWIAQKNGGGTYDKKYIKFPWVGRFFSTGFSLGSVAPGTFTVLGFSTFVASGSKNSSLADLSGGAIVAPATGIYAIKMWAQFSANAVGGRGLTLALNNIPQNLGEEINFDGNASSNEMRIEVSDTIHRTEGDLIQLAAWQSSGGSLTCNFYGSVAMVDPGQ